MKHISKILLMLAAAVPAAVQADEGMWPPFFLQQKQSRMAELGCRITAEEIYSADTCSLKDAVVMFGGGCTGEVVSPQGLVFTNHHCGFSYIQYHSSLEHDYLTDGFWAGDYSEELPCPGLQVRFLRRIEDITDSVLYELDETLWEPLSEKERLDSVNARFKRYIAALDSQYEYKLVPFYAGNQYFLYTYRVFSDVRLVGAPPSNIGKFGGDSDNWMFPRHTGDFSVFRIYADSNNNPAPYSPSNRPYNPVKYLSISLNGYQEGDFTMVFGYPYATREYESSYAVQQTLNQEDPLRIEARTKRLDVIKKAMDNDARVRIQYAAKAASIANGWKKWMGEVKGLQRLHTIENKQLFEKDFTEWTATAAGRKYAGVLPGLKKKYKQYEKLQAPVIDFTENFLAVEAVQIAWYFRNLIKVSKEGTDAETEACLQKCLTVARDFYKNYSPEVDYALFLKMHASTDPAVFTKSIFTHPDKLFAFLESYKPAKYKVLEQDAMYVYAAAGYTLYNNQTKPRAERCKTAIDSLQRLYMQGQLAWRTDLPVRLTCTGQETRTPIPYPDANFTLRVAFGQVSGFKPADGVTYKHYSTLTGIMQKENPDVYDYVVEPKLKELYNTKDYGRYANEYGEMPVAFIGSNHTTGGNSGSPVLNAHGQLIGINFDRNWEGTMSDLNYSADLCRNIMLDIRYCLFIIDKFAGAQRLIEELDL